MNKKNTRDYEIEKALQPVVVRLLYQHYLNSFGRGLAIGTVLSVLLLLLSFVHPLPDVYFWCVCGCLISVIFSFIIACILRPDYRMAARCADSNGLKERITTALEASGNKSLMAKMQRMDALAHLKVYDAKLNFPVKYPLKEGRVCIFSVVIIGFMLLLPNPMQAEIEKQDKVEKIVAKQVQKVKAVKKEMKDKQAELSLEQREAAINTLDELEAELKDTKTLSEALKSISKAEDELNQLHSSEKYSGEENIEEMVNALKSLELTKKLGDKISEGDIKGSREETADLLEQFGEKTENHMINAGSRLQKEAANMTDGGLGAALNSLGAAAQSGVAGRKQANNLQNIMGRISGQAGFQNDLNHTLAALGDARKALLADNSGLSGAQARIGDINSGTQGNSCPTGSSSGNCPGNGNSGSGQSNGNSAGSGSGSGSGPGAGMGEGGESDSINRGTDGSSPLAGGELAPMNYGEYEKVFVPRRVGQSGESSFVQGRAGEGPEEVVQTSDPALMRGTLRPYREVVGQYSQAARESLDRSSIPAGMKDLVRDYFSTLEE